MKYPPVRGFILIRINTPSTNIRVILLTLSLREILLNVIMNISDIAPLTAKVKIHKISSLV